METVKDRGIKFPSIRTMVKDGAAAALLFSAAGCGFPVMTKPVNTENPQAWATAQPTPLESATPYVVNFAELDKLESQAIKQIESEFNIRVEEDPGIWPENIYLFAFDPKATETLRKSLSLFPDDFYATSYGDGRGRITLILGLDDYYNGERTRSIEDIVMIPAVDVEFGFDSQGYPSSLGLDLAQVLAQRKDDENGNKTTNQIVKILGGKEFVKILADLRVFLGPGAIDSDSYTFARNADGSVDISKMIGVLAEFYISGDEAFFVEQLGSAVSPGVTIDDPNYSSSKIHQMYEAMKELFSGRTYGLPSLP